MVTNDFMMKVDSIFSSAKYQSGDFFGVIKEMVTLKRSEGVGWQKYIDQIYDKIHVEIISNTGRPVSEVKFGTSGWRGILGKDIFCKSTIQVTMAIVEMYKSLKKNSVLANALGVSDFKDVQKKGCVVGFDNRFDGEILARMVVEVLDQADIKVYYAGESTTGVLSASILQLHAAFSVNLTPSHNPLEYGGFKFNAADGGPAASEVTDHITTAANKIIEADLMPSFCDRLDFSFGRMSERVVSIDSLSLWKKLVISNEHLHGLQYGQIIEKFEENNELVVVVDSLHGASRLHISELFNKTNSSRLVQLRNKKDITFGGVAPEPSSKNLQNIVVELNNRSERLKIGAIIDPDGDRIRFTDGSVEISMNQFGAMAYHFLHEVKMRKGMVAKTVATSNFANNLAKEFKEDIFEPRVGFKEFKPVIGKALVYFEESDGISIIGHTPEKDAYIGLLLALDMVLTTGKNLGEYLHEIEDRFGRYYPERDGVSVSLLGAKLLVALSGLEKYKVGVQVDVGEDTKWIVEVIEIDGRKMILDDGSWLMIRPSGTEPKVRFYVEARTPDGAEKLVDSAMSMLGEVGLI